jgi:hypothetical protein
MVGGMEPLSAERLPSSNAVFDVRLSMLELVTLAQLVSTLLSAK